LSEWLNDKKNQPKIIGAFVAVMLLVAGVFVFPRLFGGGGSPDAAAPVAPAPGVPGGAPTPDATGGQPMPPDAAAPAPAPDAGGAPAAAAAPAEKQPPLEEFKADPFQPYVGPKPPRTKPTFMAKLPKPDIRRVAPVVLKPEEQEAYIQPPQGRMAGILKNDRVFAIIESTDATPKTAIVKPGDQYPFNSDFAVDRILPDRVVLRTTKTKEPRFFDLPKSAGRVTAQPGAATRTPRGPSPAIPDPGRGMPGPPGGIPPPAP
jgi:hypothetical protein